MYQDMKEVYWLNFMMKDKARLVVECSNCKQLMVEHQNPGGLVQDIIISSLKWNDVRKDFSTCSSRTQKQHLYMGDCG